MQHRIEKLEDTTNGLKQDVGIIKVLLYGIATFVFTGHPAILAAIKAFMTFSSAPAMAHGIH